MKAVEADKAPRAIGPYSQAIVAGDLVFCSGQIGLDPASGELVTGGVKEQAIRVFLNLKEVLSAAGCSLSGVISVNVYLAHMLDFKDMNEVYAAQFGEHKPARATVGVSELPKGALVEISCIATTTK